MDKPQKHYAKWKMSDTKYYIWFHFYELSREGEFMVTGRELLINGWLGIGVGAGIDYKWAPGSFAGLWGLF